MPSVMHTDSINRGPSVAKMNSVQKKELMRQAWTTTPVVSSTSTEKTPQRQKSIVPPTLQVKSREPSRSNVRKFSLISVGVSIEVREMLLNKVVAAVIVVNTIFLGLETDYSDPNSPAKDRIFWILVESIMIIIFTAEIVVRMYIERCHWPCSLWNWLDFCIVIVSVVETWILNFMEESGRLRVMGLLRCVRMLRLVRVFRLLRMFSPLYTTVMAFKEALSGLFYIGLIMLLGIYVCAIFITAVVGRGDMRELQLGTITGLERFGTVIRSMYSLFELITLEGWVDVARPIIEQTPAMAFFFFFFIIMFTFVLLQMVVAVVVEKTLLSAKKCQQGAAEMKSARVAEELEKMREAFVECDINQDETIDRDEFAEAMSATNTDGKLKACFEALDIPTDDALTLFDILDADVSGQLNMQEFLNGVARVLGASDPLWDHLATHAVMTSLRKQFQEFHQHVRQAMAKRPKLLTISSMEALETWLPKPLTPPAWT